MAKQAFSLKTIKCSPEKPNHDPFCSVISLPLEMGWARWRRWPGGKRREQNSLGVKQRFDEEGGKNTLFSLLIGFLSVLSSLQTLQIDSHLGEYQGRELQGGNTHPFRAVSDLLAGCQSLERFTTVLTFGIQTVFNAVTRERTKKIRALPLERWWMLLPGD